MADVSFTSQYAWGRHSAVPIVIESRYPQTDLSVDAKSCSFPSYDIQDGGNFTFLCFPSSLRFK